LELTAIKIADLNSMVGSQKILVSLLFLNKKTKEKEVQIENFFSDSYSNHSNALLLGKPKFGV
jgi:hypothetical protein